MITTIGNRAYTDPKGLSGDIYESAEEPYVGMTWLNIFGTRKYYYVTK